MKYILVIAISIYSLIATADEAYVFDESVVELSKTMGIEDLLSSILDQSRDAMKSSMSELTSEFEKEFPDMTVDQKARLRGSMDKYIDTVMDSIDTEIAAQIYMSVIAENMQPREIETATEYYRSPEGKNLTKTVSEAASLMNEYLLAKMTEATKVSMVELGQDITQLRRELVEK